VGCIVPAGIATDHTTRLFFRELMETGTLVSLYGFREIRRVFPGTDSRDGFALLTIAGRRVRVPWADLVFDAREVSALDQPERHVRLRADELKRFNPNTGTCPVFRARRDATIARGIYERVPILVGEGPPERNPWRISLRTMFDMANDSHRFRTRQELEDRGFKLRGNVFTRGEHRYLPLWEAKMMHHFDHRFGDYRDRPAWSRGTALPSPSLERLQDPGYAVLPRYWLPAVEVEARLQGRWDAGWFLGWRDICRSADVRTVIACVLPRTACGHTIPLAFPRARERVVLAACLSSFVVDYAARQKVRGAHLSYHVLKQLPILPPQAFRAPAPWAPEQLLCRWLSRRIVELVYTTWDLRPFARDCGWHGPPFGWDGERRLHLRCELDAAFFHLYGIRRAEVDHIMESFPIVKRRDRALHGEYRTKLLIVELYDRMQHAMSGSGQLRSIRAPCPARFCVQSMLQMGTS